LRRVVRPACWPAACSSFSCRDIKEACEDAERKWASKVLRKVEGQQGQLPPEREYTASVGSRRRAFEDGEAGGNPPGTSV
jgi:hypothetical protein